MSETTPTPDHLEEDLADLIDDAVPSRGYEMLPLVGIGGSAGAIPALQTLLGTLPAHCGAAFVVIIHLAADRESMLAEILQRATSLRVVQIRETTKVEPDTVYVIPPGKAIRSANGYLRLMDLESPRGRRIAVDLFFRALADTHGPHAAAVTLSGGDADGALGLKRIKKRGGLTVAQDPAEAGSPDMPKAAIATGMVDWILPVAEIGARVLNYFSKEKDLDLPSEQGPQPAAPPSRGSADDAPLREVLAFLRTATGRDFSYYKRATIVRRIGRRMQVNDVADLPSYLDCLRTRPGEAAALLQDLLISVTNFFRDANAFDALASQVPALFEDKGPNDAVRVWVAACATGEEAYSVAMLLSEHARTLDAPPTIQIFATDLDESAVQTAREGAYPTTIEADVSSERLRRFFIKEPDGYRVRRELREMVLFATHDLMKDSPFSRLDLATCRNLLIYLDPEAQARAFQVLAFALHGRGRLFVGASEMVDEANPDFSVLDKKHRIYQRRASSRTGIPMPSGPSSLAIAMRVSPTHGEGPMFAGRVFQKSPLPAEVLRPAPVPTRNRAWSEIHLKLLEHLAPPSALVDADAEIIHASNSVGRFLQYTGGEPTSNLLRLALPALRAELRSTLHLAAQSGLATDMPQVVAAIDGRDTAVTATVTPVRDGDFDFRLVMFRTHDDAQALELLASVRQQEPQPLVAALDAELERMRVHLRDTVDQYETSTQELKASNEELQAINEELRSATEELETSREELQSINEELSTVNHELKGKVDELAHSNSDMQNLMDATAIATVFLDREFRITRYTPSAVRLFNLIPSDVGRPLTDLTPQFQYPQLSQDAAAVLERLAPIEREVGRQDGSWFLARLLPYRAAEDRIAGVVLSFINITERKLAEEVSQWLSAVVASSRDAILSFSPDGKILSWNGGADRIFGFKARDTIGASIRILETGDGDREMVRLLERVARGENVENVEIAVHDARRNVVHVAVTASPIVDGGGKVIGGTATARDIGDARRAAEALRRSEERLRLIIKNTRDYAIFSTDMARRITSWNVGAEQLLGFSEGEIVGQPADVIFTDEDRASGAAAAEAAYATLHEKAADERFHQRKNGTRFWGSGILMRMHDASGDAIGFVKVLRDDTAAREAQAALQRSQADLVNALAQNEQARMELQAADAAKDRFIAVLSHELRNPLASVTSAAALLTADQTSEPEKTRAAQVVQRQARSMKVLVDDLLDVSRLAVGQLELRRLDVSVGSVVDAALETANPLIEAAQHRLDVRMPHVPLYLHVDPLRICQALVNLLTNAARYTPPGGELVLEVEVAGDYVEIVVRDNGIGMTEQIMERIFDLYAQGPAQTQRPNEGLGVGLALVRNIVKLHGGGIDAFSEGPGKGSHFRLTLPLVEPPDTPEQVAALPPPAAPVTPLRVLIADDNRDASWTLGRLLEAAGYPSMTASSGPEALDMAERERPDVIILDIGMPGMSGTDVARSLRQCEWTRVVPVIALTGWGATDGPLQVDPQFDAVLTKPVDMAALLKTISETTLGRRPQPP